MTEALQPRRRLQITQRLQQTVTKPVLPAVATPSIPPASRDKPLPLSFAQQRVWIMEQLTPGSPLYTIPVAWRLSGPLDSVVLERSFAAIVQRHESLRTVFQVHDGEPRQSIKHQMPCSLHVLDIRQMDQSIRTEEVQHLLEQEAQRTFDLEQGPLFSLTLVQLEDREHLLVLSLHHSIADAESIEIILRELAILYQAERRGHLASLPTISIQPADFAVWQRQMLADDALQEQLDYWKATLAGAPLLNLPTDHPRPAIQSFQGARETVLLPTNLGEGLKAISQQQGMTLFMTLLTAFKLLLVRYTGQTDIIVGTAVTSRTHVELEHVIGFLANTIALRTDLSGNLSFMQALQRVRHSAVEAYAHQETPFEKVVDALHLERDLSRSPLFQIMFAFQQASAAALSMDTLRIEPVYFDVFTTKFDITFTIVDAPDGLICTMEYNTALFERKSIQGLLESWQVLLNQLVANPQQPLHEISLISAEGYQDLLASWQAPWSSPLPPRLFLESFADQVHMSPDTIAVSFEDAQLTYAELDMCANRLAHLLQRRGVGPDVVVGLCLSRSLEVLVTLLAILKAGGAYLPLDPSYPRQRLDYMLTDAQVRLVLTQQQLLERLPEGRATYLCLEQLAESQAYELCTTPQVELRAEHLAYIIYTSGTTGHPKGAMISHGGLSNYLTWAATFYGVERGMGSVVHSSLSFDLTVTSLFTPLLVGRQVVMVEEAAGVEALARTLRTWRHISLLKVTPAHIPLLDTILGEDDLKNLELTLVIGGEALARGVLERWMRWSPRSRLINEYGPTETVVGCSLYEITPDESALQVPIGRPIVQTQIYLLDAGWQPVPIGVIGEIYIAGAGVARGYWNQPAVTAERFLPDPWSRIEGARMYRSGDYARYRADGVLEYLGRADHQVKVRGYRIELGEIEAALAQHPAVQESAVLVRENMAGEKQLVAYLVCRTQPFPTGKDLRHSLLQVLPEYMIPASFLVVEKLPLNPNGKVDRQKLLTLEQPALAYGNTSVPPRNALETRLVDVWKSILRREELGIYDNFFELGGDSLQVIRMVAAARTAGLQFTPQHLFQQQTVADLAAAMMAADPTTSAELTAMMPDTPHESQQDQIPDIRVLQPASVSEQQAFLGSRQPLTFPPHTRYVVNMVEMQAQIEIGIFHEALRYIVQHHDVLRLNIVKEQADVHLFMPGLGAEPVLSIEHIASLSEQEQQQSIQYTAMQLYRSLNTYNGRLTRFVYFDRGKEKPGLFLMVLHHILVDDYSVDLLYQDLQRVYFQLVCGEPPYLARTASLNDLALRIRRYLQTDFLEELDYWSELHAHMRQIPTDFPHPQTASPDSEQTPLPQSKPDVVTLALEREETQKLLQISQRQQTTIEDVIIAGFAWAAAPWLGEPDFHLYILNNGRLLFDDIDVSRTFGFLTTGLWNYFHYEPELSPKELLLSTLEQRNRVPNKGMGLAMAINYGEDNNPAWAQIRRTEKMQRATELYLSENIIFNYHGIIAGEQSSLDTAGRPAEPRYQDLVQPSLSVNGPQEGQAPSRLQLDPVIKDERLLLTWKYDQVLYKRATIVSLAERQREAIRALIEE